MTRTTGFVAGAALAAGLAIGIAGSALAAGPTSSASYRSMMGGGGLMSGSSYGPGMMGGLSSEQIQRCDDIHDAMHNSVSPSTSASPR